MPWHQKAHMALAIWVVWNRWLEWITDFITKGA
jgi:hypothetical protein